MFQSRRKVSKPENKRRKPDTYKFRRRLGGLQAVVATTMHLHAVLLLALFPSVGWFGILVGELEPLAPVEGNGRGATPKYFKAK